MATELKVKQETLQPTQDEATVAKIVATFDMDKTITFFIGLISMLGDTAIKLGKLEEENKEIPQIIKVIGSNPKLFLNQLLEKASGDEIKTLILAMLKLDELNPKISNLFSLTSEEKKKTGEELIIISKEIENSYVMAKQKTCEAKT